jgi:hypothetical protein
MRERASTLAKVCQYTPSQPCKGYLQGCMQAGAGQHSWPAWLAHTNTSTALLLLALP